MVFLEYWIPCRLSLTQDKQIMTGNTMFLKYKFIKKFLIYEYWTKDVSLHNFSLHVVCSIYYFLGFSKFVYLFFLKKTFFVTTFYYAVSFLSSEIKIATIKMHRFWRTVATFLQFLSMNCNVFISIQSVGRQEDRMNSKFLCFLKKIWQMY